MMRRWRRRLVNTESGQASMVTVAMFMMLFAVVAVSFTYIVVSITRQTTNDTLQSVARSAAESGVEDAKRLLVFCYKNRIDGDTYSTEEAQAICPSVIGHTLDEDDPEKAIDCNSVLGAVYSTGINGDEFNIEEDGQGGYRAKVGLDNSSDEASVEYYQCLKIATRTPIYKGVANANAGSAIVPLQLVDDKGNTVNPARIVISWHRNVTGESGDGEVELGGTSGVSLPSESIWNGQNRPAVLRVEQLVAQKNNVSVDGLVQNDSAVTLRPSTGGTNNINITSYHPARNDGDGANDTPNAQYNSVSRNAPIVEARCSASGSLGAGGEADYACAMQLTGTTIDLANNNGYLRLNAIYRDTHFAIRAYDSAGNQLYFDGVQPVVDVTGRSSDSFTRIQANLEPAYSDDDTIWWPEYAIETDGKVCKDIDVYYDNGTDNCGSSY